MSQTAQTVWPEGVIARYLTVAAGIVSDATILVEVAEESPDDIQVKGYRASCRGCGAIALHDRERTVATLKRERVVAADAERLARDWAQSHAETCRAMPRPTA